MTAPINFPTLQSPQVVPGRNTSDGFAEFLTALANQRFERAKAREQLDLQRRQLDNTEANDKITRKKQERELEIADLKLNAEDIADRYAREATTTPGLDEAGVSEIMGRMLSTEDKKLAPYLTEAFMRQVKGHQDVLASVAQRQSAQTEAKVAGATADARINTTKTNEKIAETTLARAGVELATAKVQQHLAEMDATYGPGRSALANAVLQNGGTLGQAYRISGVPVPDGVDPNWTVPDKTNGAGSDAQRKLQNVASQVTLGNALIDASGDPEVSGLGALIRRGGSVGGLVELLKSKDLTNEERQAITGYRMLGEGFALYVTGQQASAAQVDRLVGVISKQPGETGKAAETRAFVRSAVVQLVQNAAAGGSPAEGMQKIVDEAKKRGADARTLSVLQSFALDAKKAEAKGKVGPDSTATPSATDAVVRGRFGIAKPPTR